MPYQTGSSGKLRPVMLMNELQALAGIHAETLGRGISYCIARGCGWIVTHYFIDIREMPTWGEELELTTWPVEHDGLRAIRDFEVRGADGRLMIAATSQWIMANLETRRPMRLNDVLTDWPATQERALNAEFDKMPEIELDQNAAISFRVRYDDIDSNNHVNNTVYIVWAIESLGMDFLNSHDLTGIKINFKKEVPSGTRTVVSGYQINGNTTQHVIQSSDTTNASVILTWKPR